MISTTDRIDKKAIQDGLDFVAKAVEYYRRRESFKFIL